MCDLLSLPIFKKQSGTRQTVATQGPAIRCFAHQNKLVLLLHKHTHFCAFMHLSCFTEEEGHHAAHTQGQGEGRQEVCPQVEVFRLITNNLYYCGQFLHKNTTQMPLWKQSTDIS